MASFILNIYSCYLKPGYNIKNMRMFMWRLRKVSIMPTVRKTNSEKYFESWDTKIHVPCNYLQSFYVDALIDECGLRRIIHLQCFKMVSQKRRDHLINSWWKMELLRCLLILQCHPRKRKIAVPRL